MSTWTQLLEQSKKKIQPIPAGRYDVEIISVKIKAGVESKFGLTNIMTIAYRITSGPYENRRVWDNIFFKNADVLLKKVKPLGFSSEALASVEEPEDIMVGKEYWAQLEPDPKNPEYSKITAQMEK